MFFTLCGCDLSSADMHEIKLNKKKPTIIRVIKENEAHISTIYLKDILLENASFENIETSNRPLIGFFGDSLTCGYGLLDYKGLTFKTEYEEFTKSYAYLTSFALNMDYLVVARSGISIALKIYCDRLFKEVYDTVDMYQKCSFDRKVDYAVFNLGTNDSGAYSLMDEKDKEPSRQLFIKEFILLIERIIKDNPGVKIVIIYNMVLIEEKMNDAIKEVKEYIQNHYENKIELLKFIPNGDGGCGHPYYPNHEENSKLLIETIKKMG